MLGLVLSASGCKDFFNINTDPLNPTSARVQELLPVAQANIGLNLGFGLGNLSQLTSTLTGQLASSRDVGSYSLDGSTGANQWAGLYTDCLINNEQIIKQATAANQPGYLGIAQLQKAFVFSQMVDMWGNIPYSEALQGTAIRNPKFDRDADIYRDLIRLIDEGIGNCGRATGTATGDLIYGSRPSQFANWQRMGRTLKLKLYNQARLNPAGMGLTTATLATAVTNLLPQDMLSAPEQDFEVAFGVSITPENRNPGYQANYGSTSREDFMGRYLFELMKTNQDPRIPYYYYRQKTAATPEAQADYQSPLDLKFVTRLLGSNGRNANQAIDNIQTLFGLYPVGGKYDDGLGGVANPNSGSGKAPQRLLTTYSRYFTEAELKTTVLSDPTGARTALEAGLRASFAKVSQVASDNAAPAIAATAVDNYVNAAMARYDAAASNAKLTVIMREKYVASFGFGPDVYTDYRRTGFPAFPMPGQEPGTINTSGTGFYPRVLPYRQADLTSNSSAPGQHNVATDRLFWDVRQ